MKMHVLPAAIFLLPNSSFLDGSGHGGAVFPDSLIQANISDYRHIAHDPDSGRTHGRLMLSASAAKLEVKAMKVQTFDELPLGFRLKGGQSRIAELLVDSPIGVGNRIQQTLIESQQLVTQGIGHWYQTSLAVSRSPGALILGILTPQTQGLACVSWRHLAIIHRQDTHSGRTSQRMNNSDPLPRSSLDNNETRT